MCFFLLYWSSEVYCKQYGVEHRIDDCLCAVGTHCFSHFDNLWIGFLSAKNITPRYLEQQRLRKDLLRKHCAGVNQSLFNLNNIDLNNLIVDDQHGIIYCYIPKVACTNWKRTLIALKQNEPYPDPMSFKSNMVHKFDRFRLLKNYSMPERKVSLCSNTRNALIVSNRGVMIISFTGKTTPSFCLSVIHLCASSLPTGTRCRNMISTFMKATLESFCNAIKPRRMYLLNIMGQKNGSQTFVP
uniref:Carbohydrate sulfotransferase n=1 Tax=Oryzias sinensis TaxID=183150 RepID=A0A8C8DIT0_9TELE